MIIKWLLFIAWLLVVIFVATPWMFFEFLGGKCELLLDYLEIKAEV